MDELHGKQIKALLDALLDAFPTKDELRRIVRVSLDQNLERISLASNLEGVIFDLIEWAESRGKVSELLKGAKSAKPDNPRLRKIVEELLGYDESMSHVDPGAYNFELSKDVKLRLPQKQSNPPKHPINKDLDQLTTWFFEELAIDEQSYLLTIAMFQGMERYKLLSSYAQIREITSKYL